MDLFSPGFCLCGSVDLFLLWKNFLSFSVCLFLPLHSSLTQFFCLSRSISLCTIFHVLTFLSLPVPLRSPSFPLSLFLSLCLKFSPRFHLSFSHTFSPYRRPSFDGLHPLLSSSRLLQPLFSQDASLQGVLHQNGTETEREEGVGSCAWF